MDYGYWRGYSWRINGNRSTLSGLGFKGNPPRKLVPIRDLGTAPHKEGRQSEMKDVPGFMSISLGSKSQFSPNFNGCDSFPDATGLQIPCCIQAEPKKTRPLEK